MRSFLLFFFILIFNLIPLPEAGLNIGLELCYPSSELEYSQGAAMSS
jgi:hypothetical protein